MKAPPKVRSLARAHTENALAVLASIMSKETASDSARVSAASALLDRGWGKATQPLSGDDDSDPISIRTIVTGVPRETDDKG